MTRPTLYVSRDMSVEQRLRFYGWTVTPSGCWEWNGGRNQEGYGNLWVGTAMKKVHRLAYELWIGPIPDDLPGTDYRGVVVMHSCDNPPCLNPAHLSVGTHADNMQDRGDKGRTSSARGEAIGTSKLIQKEVDEIRSATGVHRIIAEKYGVTRATVSRIKRGVSWIE